MKKTSILSVLVFTFSLLLTANVQAQKFADLDKSPMDASFYRTERNAPPIAKVVYGRPQLKGRSLDKLTPKGKVWRTGANESTEITFFTDVTFGGQSVKAGTYSLFTIPGDEEWTVILNSDLNTWGSYSYNDGNDVVRVQGKVSQDANALEAFSITFADGNMHLGWDTVRVAVSISN